MERAEICAARMCVASGEPDESCVDYAPIPLYTDTHRPLAPVDDNVGAVARRAFMAYFNRRRATQL